MAKNKRKRKAIAQQYELATFAVKMIGDLGPKGSNNDVSLNALVAAVRTIPQRNMRKDRSPAV